MLPQTIVIGVANFSEKFPLNANRFWNLKLLRTILNFERIYFKDLRVDCWQCIYGARLFAKLRRNEMAKVYNLKGFSKGVDSSLNLIFEKGTPVKQDVRKVNTILFTSDIMLDRGVKNLIKKKGLYYPFEKLSSFFNRVDFVVGNLEGTIQENASESRKSMKFSFSPEVVEALSNNNFRLLSLANNHSFDFGKTGLEKTMVFLKNAKIDFIGNPLKIDKDSLIEIEKISFLALNKTYNFNSPDDEIAELIKKIKFSDKNKFLVVFFHWGEEYQTKSSPTQRELAHKIIDAGADLIIGSHPHVVQEIEIFNKKLIFYSLGNFIFDQYFSEETQKGLIVGLEKYPEKIRYWLFPLKSVKSQPFLMEMKRLINTSKN
ncbi:MAG: CapA family protein [Candidatus Aminicenantia bacterium]